MYEIYKNNVTGETRLLKDKIQIASNYNATPIFQQAFNEAVGDKLKVHGNSTYIIDNTLYIQEDTHGLQIEFEKHGASLQLANNVNKSMIMILDNCTRINFINLRLRGNSDNNTTGHGINIKNNNYGTRIINSEIRDFANKSINCNANDIGLNNLIVSHCSLTSKEGGIYLRKPHSMCIIENSAIGAINDHRPLNCIQLVDNIHTVVQSNGIYGANYGLNVTGRNVRCLGNYFHVNYNTGLKLDADHSIISNNTFYGNSQDNLLLGAGLLLNGKYNNINNNQFLANLGWFNTPWTNNQKYGVYENGNADYNIITNNIFKGNSVSNIRSIGLNSIIDNNIV